MDEKRREDMFMKGLSEAELAAELVIKYFDKGTERDELLRKVENRVKNLCLQHLRMKETRHAVEVMKNELHQRVAAQADNEDELVVENIDTIDNKVEERKNQAMEKANVSNHPFMKKYIAKIACVVKKVEEVRNEDGDEELLLTDATESYIDPITKTTIVDPVKSKVCKHQFGRASITQQINAHDKGYTKCPYMGCNRKITQDDLEDDLELAQDLDRLQLRTKS